MKKTRLLLIGCVVVLSAWAASWSQEGPVELIPAPKAREVKVPGSFRFQGSGSCAASACHNGQGMPGAPGSEYTTWAAHSEDGLPRDPHARAHSVLFSGTSQRMSRALGRDVPAHQDSLCLNCHVVPNHDLVQAKGLLPENFAADGVSCESCHGPAEAWLVEHYRPGWRAKSPAEKAALGMKDMRSIVNRAKVCAECHVGSLPAEKGGLGQDVYHDLYAAGHPPLVFEFAAYHASLLHHWQDARDRDPAFGGTPDFEARAWLLGQVVSAQAGLDLLAHRAADASRPWPEFAEMDCFACHHDLKGTQDRTKARATKRPGAIPFRSWYYTMLPRSLETLGAADEEVAKSAARLKDLMEDWAPDRETVAKEALSMRKRLDAALAKVEPREPIDVEGMYDTIRAKDVPRSQQSWDNAAQVFLSIAALENTWSDLKLTPTHGNLPSTLEAIRTELRFPKGFLSPARFDGDSVREKMERLRK